MNRRVTLVAGLLLPALLAGCWPARPPRLTGSGMDMFAPVHMRIHPLSRIVPGAAKDMLEVRIELTDQFDDVGKGAGTLHLELYRYELAALGHKGNRVLAWDEDLSTPEPNRDHWDRITRSYLFKHELDVAGLAPEEKFVLVATMTLPKPNETRLKPDEFTLSLKPPGP